MGEVEEEQEKMKADREAMKEQKATIMEAMMSMKKIMEANVVAVAATSAVAKVNPMPPSDLNQIIWAAPIVCKFKTKHTFPPYDLPPNYTPPNVAYTPNEDVNNSTPILIESRQPHHVHVSQTMGETHEIPHHNLADFEPCLGYATEGQVVCGILLQNTLEGPQYHPQPHLLHSTTGKNPYAMAEMRKDLAAQVVPSVTEKEMITMIVDTLPVFYYEKMVDYTPLSFADLVFAYERIEVEANLIILLGRMRKIGTNEEDENEGETHVVTAIPIRPSFPPIQQCHYSANNNPSPYPPPSYPQRPSLNQPQNPSTTQPMLNTTFSMNQNTNQGRNFAAKGLFPQPPFFQGYDSNTMCAYHGGAPGHSIEHCMTVKRKGGPLGTSTLTLRGLHALAFTGLHVHAFRGLHVLAFKGLHALAFRGLHALTFRGLHVLAIRGLHALAFRGLHVFTFRGLHVLAFIGLDVLAFRGLHVLAFKGLCILAFRGLHVLAFRGLNALSFRGLHALTFRGLHVLAIRGLHALTFKGLHILAIRGLHALAFRELHVLTFRGLHVLSFRGLDVLTFRGLHVLAFKGLRALAFRGLDFLAFRGLDVLAFIGLHALTFRGLDFLAFRGLDVLAFRGLDALTFRRLHALTFRGLHVLAIRGLHAFTFIGLHILAIRGLHALTFRGLHVLTFRGLHVLSFRGIDVLAFRGLHVLAFRGQRALAFGGLDFLTFRGLDVLAFRGLDVLTFRGLHALAIIGLHALTFRGLHVLTFRGMHTLAVRGLHVLAFRGLHVLAFRGLHVLAFRGMHVLTFRGLHVLIFRGLHVLAIRGLHALTFRRLHVLTFRGLHILTFRGLHALAFKGGHVLNFRGLHALAFRVLRVLTFSGLHIHTLKEFKFPLSVPEPPPDIGGRQLCEHNQRGRLSCSYYAYRGKISLVPLQRDECGSCAQHDHSFKDMDDRTQCRSPPAEVSVGIATTRHPVDPEKSNKALGFPALVTGLCLSYRVPVPPARDRARKTPCGPKVVQQGPGVSSSDYGPRSVLRSACRPQQGAGQYTIIAWGWPAVGNRRTAATSRAPQLIHKKIRALPTTHGRPIGDQVQTQR
ncbi:Dynein heavy chain [Glycine soja]